MTRRIKVLHIISNLMSGGAEAMLSKVARASAKSDVDHVVISMITGGIIADDLATSDIPVHFLGAGRSFGAVTHIGEIRQLARDLNPDLIQGWMYHGNIAGTAGGLFNGRSIPVIWNVRQTVRTLRHESLLTAFLILLGAPLSRSPRAIIYNSLHAAEDHERFGYTHKRRVIIPNGFDTELFRPSATSRGFLLKELRLPANAAIVGRVANFHTHKDFPTLMAAFASIARQNPRAHLVMVGRGLDSKNHAFAALMASLPFSDRVRIMGERSDVAQIIPGFDVLLSSSSAEAFPNVIGEAMACGVSTVTTDAGDCREVLGDPERVVARGDAEALAQATLQLLSLDPAERAAIGSRDRARVIERYSIEAVAAQYAALWRQAVADA